MFATDNIVQEKEFRDGSRTVVPKVVDIDP